METKTGSSNCFSEKQTSEIKLFVRKRRSEEVKGKRKARELERRTLKLLPEPAYAPPAQVLYRVMRDGTADLRPIPLGTNLPWKSLPCVFSASLAEWEVNRGDIVIVDIGEERDDFAKVSDLRRLPDGRYVVVYAWLYTRGEICREFERGGVLTPRSRNHINKMWPLDTSRKFMLSTNRTITLWDTAIAKAPENVTAGVFDDKIYSTTARSRRIVNVNDSHFKWMKEILRMKPGERGGGIVFHR